MSSTNEAKFTKLKGRENYDTWRMAAKSYLVIKGYWSCVLKVPKADKNEEMEKDLKAWSEINLLLDESVYSYMTETTTAKGAWDALEKAFQDSGVCRRVHLLKQLVQIQLEECDSTEDYVNKIMTTSQKVKKSGLNLDDEVIASLLLAGLPTKMDPLVMAVENSGKDLTVEGVKTLLLQETRLDEGKQNGQAFAAKKKQRTTVRCYNCDENGHIARNCPKERTGEANAAVAF